MISFIFADLIAFPLLMIYRRYYGTRLMLRMLAVFWALMSTAGLVTEGIFRAAGLVPTIRPTTVAPAHFSWNYTTYLNIVFLLLFASSTGSTGTGSDSERESATPRTRSAACRSRSPRRRRPRKGGERFYFCSDRCAEHFGSDVGATSITRTPNS